MITIQRFQVNPIQENCYVVNDETREAVIIDCGAFFPEEKQALQQYIDTKGLLVKHLLMTHAHFDHVFGNQFLYKTYGLSGECHKADETLYNRLPQQVTALLGDVYHEDVAPLKCFIDEGDVISFGTHAFTVIHTPGHSQGGLEFYCEAEKCLFSGDSLFRGSIGRTDFPEGNYDDMIKSLSQKILTLPPDTRVYTGHGPGTTIGYEKENNPYL
jgi:hydroxyacylglutathione hydrolase